MIETKTEERVHRICINRPEKKNAITNEMYEQLCQSLRDAEDDSSVRVILLHGTQDCFTSGNDLKDFAEKPFSAEESPAPRFFRAISNVKKPIVAAVNGYAVGIGTTILLHCDLVYAGENSRFQLPFVSLGLCPEGASTYLLPRLAGHLRAAELLLLGEPFSASKAKEIGLVNEICSDDQVLSHAIEQANKLAAKPPASLRVTKSLLKQGVMATTADTMAGELEHFSSMLTMPEAKEAFSAFLERRPPNFSNFS